MLKIDDLDIIYNMTMAFEHTNSFVNVLYSKGVKNVKEFYESYIIHVDDNETWIYIPDGVFHLYNICDGCDYRNLRFVGGADLAEMNYLFKNVAVTGELDLTRLKSGNVKSIHSMFLGANIKKIKFGKDWHSLDRTSDAFCRCTIHGELDISDIVFDNLTMAAGMFMYADISSINMNNLKLPSLTRADGMFSNAKIGSLRINNVGIPKVDSLNSAFSWAEIDKLSISGIDASKIKNFTYMFLGATIKSKLDLSGLNVIIKDDRDSIESMFNGCSIPELDIRNFKVDKDYRMDNIFIESDIGVLYAGNDKILHRAMIERSYINKVIDIRKNR